MKNYIFYSFFFVLYFSFGQQGKKIDLDEVVNIAGAILQIYLNDVVYSFRERDTLIKKVLRSAFWKNIQFEIPLEDYETGKKYLFESEGPLKVSINNIELTKNHLFKSLIKIRKLAKNIIKVEIRNDQEKTNIEK